MIIIKIYTKIEISNSSDSEEFGKIFSDFDKKLTQTFGEKSIGGYHLTNTAYKELSENEDFLKLRKQLTKGTFKEAYPSAIELYTVDYSIYKLMNIKIVDGRNLNKDDFTNKEKNEIPIIVSNIYSNIIKLNNIYIDNFEKRKYKVVGFFDNKLFWLDNNDNPIKSKLISLSDKIITPYFIYDDNGLDSVIKS